jgi:hypothetical protein
MENKNDVSFLENDETSAGFQVMKEITNDLDLLNEFKCLVDLAEKNLKRQTERYEGFKKVIVDKMVMAGVYELKTSKGAVKVVENMYCSPNKNAHDRAVVNKWLVEQGLEHLIATEGKVEAQFLPLLDEAGILYSKNEEVNTQSLKSALKAKLGMTKGSMAVLEFKDIPKEINCFIKSDIVLETK